MLFVSKIKELRSLIKKSEKELEKLSKKESRAIALWRKGYQFYQRAAKEIATLKRRGTKKEEKMKDTILSWEEKTIGLTVQRDETREALRVKEEELIRLRLELAQIVEQDKGEKRVTDEIVEQVFMLNDKVVEALETRNGYLSVHVYDKLVDAKGKPHSQVTFDDSSGTRRVVAMVNTISKIDPALAGEAKLEIEKFFNRIAPRAGQMDEATQALIELMEEILIEKTSFKVGPHLYRFLSLSLDEEVFPELKNAQDLLKKSLRSEKTTSYVRLYTREDRTSKFERVRQQI